MYILLFLLLLIAQPANANPWWAQANAGPPGYAGGTNQYIIVSGDVIMKKVPATSGFGSLNNVYAEVGWRNSQFGVKITAQAGKVIGICNAANPISLMIKGPQENGPVEHTGVCWPENITIQLQVTRWIQGYTDFWFRRWDTGQSCFVRKLGGFCPLNSGCAAVTPMDPIARLNVVRLADTTYPNPVDMTLTNYWQYPMSFTGGALSFDNYPHPYLQEPATQWWTFTFRRYVF